MKIYDPTYAPPPAAAATGASAEFDIATDPLVMFSNSKPNAPELLHGLAARIGRRFGGRDAGFVAKGTASLAAPTPVLDEIVDRYRIAVVALGDCGSCSSYCFQDSLELERRGVSTFVIVTTVFEKLVLAHAKTAGVEPRLIVLDHPVAGLKAEDLEARIDQALAKLLALQPAGAVNA